MNNSNSGLIEVDDPVDNNSANEILNENGNGNALSMGISNATFVSEISGNTTTSSMTESMAGAKNLLDEVKDPLGINDSLYQ